MSLFDTGENNVGQFGADDTNIIRYKQAAEYAEDARLYALAAAESMVDADNLLNRAEQILQEARDILASVQNIETEVEELETRVTAAEAIANEAVSKAQQAIQDTAGIIERAKGYADSAEASASQAQGFSSTAQNYATVAQQASTQAQGFRDQADGFADEAEQHVTEANTAVTNATTQADRSKAEADRAAEIVANIPGKETIEGFAKVYKNKDDADADVTERNVGEKVLVWEEANSTYSWYDVTGTSTNKALTLNSSEKRLKTVNNIQPDNSGNIQVTLPGGNPSLWLGETIFFQYDPDKNVSYPGLLPQDGREVNRADYPDLWQAIENNFVPSVTEAVWQSGKTNCFSTGNGTTTFRVPKWSGEVLRTPNAGDEKGEIVAQIPYVVTVNGIAPDDTTGNVQIDLSSYAKTSDVTLAINNATANKATKGANTDITSLSGLTTALSISQGGTGAKTAADARTALGLDVFGQNVAYIDNYSSLVTSGDWTAAINAAFATGLPVVGKGTYNVSGIIKSKGQKILGSFIINSSRYSLGNIKAQTNEPETDTIKILYLESAYDLAELLYIKSLGFNMINHYCYFANNGTIDSAGTAEQLLDNATTAGLRVNLGTESDRAKASLSEFVNATKVYPCVFGYSVYDEPAARGISISDQDTKITSLRALTNKNLNFVDLLTTQPFNQVFSKNYDLAFVDSYSVRYTSGTASDWLEKDLAKMRYDFGGIKAMTDLKCIPVVSAFLDTGSTPYYSNNEAQVIAASSIFGKVGGGSFGAFVWDGVSGNFPGTVRTNANLRNMVIGLANQRMPKELATDVYIFGGVQGNTIWPISKLIKEACMKDPNTQDANVAGNAWPTRVITGSSDTDHTTTATNADYSGIGFKGSFANYNTNIKARKNQRCIMEAFNVIGSFNGVFRLLTSNDGGYTPVLRYEDSLTANKVLDFNNKLSDAYTNDTLIFRIENTGDTSTLYRKFLRGIVICCDW